jgi:hypothetical protein
MERVYMSQRRPFRNVSARSWLTRHPEHRAIVVRELKDEQDNVTGSGQRRLTDCRHNVSGASSVEDIQLDPMQNHLHAQESKLERT